MSNPTADSRPLEDRIEEARQAGVRAGEGDRNPYQIGMPEHQAWAGGYGERPQQQRDPFDTPEGIAEAAMQGMRQALAGPSFVNPFAVGTARRRAWQKAYDSTEKGVPQMSGPKGRSQEEHIQDIRRQAVEEVAKAAGVTNLTPMNEAARMILPERITGRSAETMTYTDKVVMVGGRTHNADLPGRVAAGGWEPLQLDPDPAKESDPFHKLLAAAARKGIDARNNQLPIGANPYAEPSVGCEPLAAAWDHAWRTRENEIKFDASRRLAEELAEKADRVDALPDRFAGMVVELSPSVTQIAIAVYPFYIQWNHMNPPGIGRIDQVSATMAFEAAESLVDEYARRKQAGKPV